MRVRKMMTAAVGLTAMSLLAGCAGGSDGEGGAEGGEQKITVWLYPVIADEASHKAFWDETIAAFEKENDGITVDYEIFPWANRDEGLQTAIAANKGPDLVYLIPDQLTAYEKSIEPLDDYLSEERVAELLPNVRESVTLEPGIMGAPMLTSAMTLICNAAAFEAAGLSEFPETWDDVREMAPAFVDAGMHIFSYPASAENTLNMTFYPLLWQAGGTVYDDAGALSFAGDEGVEALTFLSELAAMGALEPTALTTMQPIEQTPLARGSVGCTWTNSVLEVEPFWGEENVTVLPPLTDEDTVAYGTVGSLSILKGSKAKEAAGAFAEFATSADVMKPYLLEAGFYSPLESTEPLNDPDTLLGQVEQYVPTTTVGELATSSRAIMGVLSPEIQAALMGTKSPEEALEAAHTAAQPLLK